MDKTGCCVKPTETRNGDQERSRINWTKPIETVNGDPARVLATDLKGRFPIAVATGYNIECVYVLDVNGSIPSEDNNNPYVRNKKQKVWINLYRDELAPPTSSIVWGCINRSKELAKQGRTYLDGDGIHKDFIVCVEVEI